MILIREDLPAGLMAIEGVGQVTKADYQDIIRPELERAFAHGEKLRFMYVLGNGFTGFEFGAMMDDAKLGLKHLGDFERIAVVCDVKWVEQVVRLINLITPCPVKVFHLNEEDIACQWLQSS